MDCAKLAIRKLAPVNKLHTSNIRYHCKHSSSAPSLAFQCFPPIATGVTQQLIQGSSFITCPCFPIPLVAFLRQPIVRRVIKHREDIPQEVLRVFTLFAPRGKNQWNHNSERQNKQNTCASVLCYCNSRILQVIC